ncbi:MAG: ABC transporter ATP-binding protein/permease [Verrucomicrobia bacterium]|nr:ABC transporter ATP-binding protein/permease [Verrucomicrobiota bacterium]
MKEEKVAINRQTIRRLMRGLAIFMKSPVGGKAKLLAAGLLFLMLCINGMNVLNSYVGRYFMSAIESRDSDGFVRYAWMYVGVFAGSTLVAVYFRFAEERLGLLWRDWLTHRTAGLYIDQRIYLHLEEDGAITNPDQRMTEDVRQLTTTTLSLLLMILNGTVTALSFSGVLWAISPSLFMVAVAYAIAGSALTILLGRPLIRLNYKQADREADFRSELIRVRENADGIALTGNESRARARLMTRVDGLVLNFRRIISVNRNLNFFTTGYNYMIQLIPVLIVAPIFIRHGVEFGVIGQSTMAFAALLGAFSLIVTQFQAISAYASVIARLNEYVEASEKAADRNTASCIGCETISDHFAYGNLTLRSTGEDGAVILKDLNVSFLPGKRVFVHGPNHAARYALFRASAGLYYAGKGTIVRPPADKLAFLTEQPYIPTSTLRELLLPPGADGEITNEAILDILEEVGLGPAVTKHDGFEAPRNWHDVLSLEEQQLMALARAVLARPDYAFFDHLDSALSDSQQKRILQLMAGRGITCVSFGDGQPDPSCHDAALELHEDGSWTWTELR